jgi:osmotically-inducible protein OsmY
MALPRTSITDRVSEALQNDPRTKDEIIEVSYYAHSTLTLTGTVRSEAARRAGEEVARDNLGAVDIVNKLKVK